MAKKAQLIGMEWGFSGIWYESIRSLPERPMQKRNYIYASELSGSFRDRYLKMHAHPYSNPFNDRAKCKMLAGNFFESIVGMVLTATGILQRSQLRGEVELPGMLKVSGRLDFDAGGNTIDWDKAKHEVEKVKQLFSFSVTEMSPFINHMVTKVFEHFKMMFTHVPIARYIMECKSVSGFVYQLIERSQTPRRGHPLQSLHYLLANKEVPSALLTYISREDVMMQEFYINRSKELLKEYRDDVATMTAFYNDAIGKDYMKHLPPPDPEVKFEEASFRFVKENKCEYSPYLTMTYGYKDIDEFKGRWDKTLAKWNVGFRRHVLEGKPTGKLGKPLKLTPGNIETIKEAQKYFPLWDKYIAQARKAGAFEKQDETEDED